MAALPGHRLTRPDREPGGLITRVLQAAPCTDLQDVVDLRFGTLRAQALAAPADAAREYLRGRMYETARGLYGRLLDRDPANWALMQEVALRLLIPSGDWAAAVDLTEAALHLNPLAPDLWRARAEALAALGRPDEAAACIERSAALAPGSPWGQMALARLHLDRAEPEAALLALARAFAADRDSDLRDTLLAVQDRALGMIAQAQIDLLTAQANVLRATDTPP
jgi:tetratricopeptide (TPR) repeat protein